VQAPRKRVDTRKGGTSRSRLWIGLGAGALVVAGAAVGIALAVGGGGSSSTPTALAGGACTLQTFPAQGRQHTPPYKVPKDFKYNSTPPTSGPHDPSPAIWDVYDSPIDQKVLLHNLEHGGIVVQYGNKVPPGQVNQIIAWYRQDPNGLIIAPYPVLGSKIATTDWTHLLSCTRFDAGAFSKFRDDYRYHGPESGFSAQYYQPGNG